MATSWGGRAKPANSVARPMRGHDLAVGLREFYAMPDNFYMQDALNPSAAGMGFTLGASSSRVNTEAGPGLKCNTATLLTFPNRINYAAADFTVQFVFQPLGFTGANSEFWSKGLEFDLFYNTSGNINLITIGGTGVGSLSSSAGLVVGSVYVVHITRASSTGACYTNGKKDGSFTSSATTAGATTLWFNGDGARGTQGNGTFISWAYWNRALSANEVALLAMDPYLPVRPLRAQFMAAALVVAPSGGLLTLGCGS